MLIPAGNPSAWTGPSGNNTYLLTGPTCALIDAGVGRPAHLDAVADALGGRPLDAILITHSHPDHVGGIPALLERWPSARVRNAGGDALLDGELLSAGGATLRAVHTPGHSPDHFCFVDDASRDVYCGDLARLGGTIVIPASAGGSLVQYLASLERIRALGPRRLLPGHGPIIDDPGGVIDEYVRHRAMREQQIVAALRDGPAVPESIVGRVYGELRAELARGARDSVLAHLIKLEEEHRARRSGDTWEITEPR